jgi:hypothetical protein
MSKQPPDDLSQYADLVDALQAPGSPDELADEQTFLAAYRGTYPAPAVVLSLPRRVVGRFGVGGTALIVAAVVGTGGVAAAVTGNLPDPVQEFAHSVIGAPAPDQPSPVRVQSKIAPGAAEESPTARPSPESSTTAQPEAAPQPEADGRGSPSITSEPEPSTSPADSDPSRDPDDEPTRTVPPPRPTPAVVSMIADTHIVEYGAPVTLGGRLLDANGAPVPHRRVVLQVRDVTGWRRVGVVRAGVDGAVRAQTAPVTGLSRYRWRARPQVRSDVWRMRVRAVLSASYAVEGDRTIVTAAAVGGRPGDVVTFSIRAKGRLTLLGEVSLAADGRALIAVRTPRRARAVVIRLNRTLDHTPARTRLTIVPTP